MKLLPAYAPYEAHVVKLVAMGMSHREAELLWNLSHAIAECYRAGVMPALEAKLIMALAADGVEQIAASRRRMEAQA